MDKKELIDRVYRRTQDPNMTKEQIREVVEWVFEVIRDEVSSGNQVSIRNFGIFAASERKATRNRNPVTQEWQEVPARMVPKFKPSTAFKREVRYD